MLNVEILGTLSLILASFTVLAKVADFYASQAQKDRLHAALLNLWFRLSHVSVSRILAWSRRKKTFRFYFRFGIPILVVLSSISNLVVLLANSTVTKLQIGAGEDGELNVEFVDLPFEFNVEEVLDIIGQAAFFLMIFVFLSSCVYRWSFLRGFTWKWYRFLVGKGGMPSVLLKLISFTIAYSLVTLLVLDFAIFFLRDNVFLQISFVILFIVCIFPVGIYSNILIIMLITLIPLGLAAFIVLFCELTLRRVLETSKGSLLGAAAFFGLLGAALKLV